MPKTTAERLAAWQKILAVRKASYDRAVRAVEKLKRQQAKPTLGERALAAAATLVGVTEQGGNNSGPKVSEIIHANGGTGPEPWCGDFVAYCYRKAGSKAVTRQWASVLAIVGVGGIRRTSKPQTGDLVRFNFPGGSPEADHIGLFVRFIPGGIETIEGNTGSTGAVGDGHAGTDGVKRKHRPNLYVKDYLKVTR